MEDTLSASQFAHTVLNGLPTSQQEPVASNQPVGKDRYRIGRRIGAGGMGTVNEAEDLQFGRVVALKVMDAEVDQRFALEAVVTANLEHPGIPAVYERGTGENDKPFYTMRLIRGRSLAEVFDEAKTLDERLRLLPAVIDVAQTIAFAHERGVIHRDIKPQNVVVGAYGETVVVDWGLAKVRGVAVESASATGPRSGESGSHDTEHGAVLGTPSYMAPEQAAGRVDEVDERSDVFAIGALMFHLFTGRAPYVADTAIARVALAVDAKRPTVGELAPTTPGAIAAVIEKAMAKSPGERYRSARELAEALQEIVAAGLRGRESRAVRVFTDATSVFVTVAMFVAAAFMLVAVDLGQLGITAAFVLATFVLGVALTAIEWWTAGRYSLSPVIVALAILTVLEGLVFVLFGATEAFVKIEPMLQNGETSAAPMLIRLAEILANTMLVPVQLCAAQVALWALARRRSLRAAGT